MSDFTHLHVHTQYSLLDGAADIAALIQKAKANEMHSIAITDHGNMFGVPKFVEEAKKAGLKPLIGCEFYVAPASRFHKTKAESKGEKNFLHQVLLAKNMQGYKNLSKLCTLGFTEGYYYKPRIDKELIRKYHDGLIATTCCLASEVNQTIMQKREEEAEKCFLDWLEIFGEDYYVELQRHGIKDQEICNEVLIKWAKKHKVKIIATNDVHYIDYRDSEAQDILLCLQTNDDYESPNRFKFESDQFYFKTKEEMAELFKDIPEAIDNTNEISDKIETPDIKRDILLPTFPLPQGFASEIDYLKHLTYEGARKKYQQITPEIQQRLDFELEVIRKMDYPGYFLIVQDFVTAAKQLGVSVGPGRGSAAGSAVAYCTGITNIDPIKYNLLFERFLNLERVSMPDIDIDFDDAGRQKVIDWVIEKYSKEKVAQIITFGTMAAKSSIRDVARVLKLPLPEADRLAKLVPEGPGVTLSKAFKEVKDLAEEQKSKNPLIIKTLDFAERLEGSTRHTGVHAAGVIIAPDNLMEYIPLCTAKDTDLLVTQYDGKYAESVGMLKMDFLGLKTLSIINDAIRLIKKNYEVEIDPDQIPLDDKKTFELYQRGETVGTFQFESPGMRNYLKELEPSNIEDLIAMNALYRPGPMDFIPMYINRKHGKEKVAYPHPLLEDILKDTYGIMVYQEQIMQAAQIMAGFSLGAADLLRRAMGKKKMDVMEQQREVFAKGAAAKGIDEEKAKEVFNVMAKFAEYGFNRSHSVAYSVVAFQTAYLKANYPAEYMAAVLTHNMNDIKKITFFMDECRRMEIAVMGPDVNESNYNFSVNRKGEIRFGLGAVKGVGEGAVEAIVNERNENGIFTSIFDLTKRIALQSANKKVLESLAMAGAFDSFQGVHRAQYFFAESDEVPNFIEKAIKFGSTYQGNKNAAQQSLFEESTEITYNEPDIPECTPWSKLEQLKREREVTGIYISGHPLDNFQLELTHLCNITADKLNNEIQLYNNKDITIAGIVVDAKHKTNKTGKPFGTFVLEDYTDSMHLALFGEAYEKLRHLLKPGEFLLIKGRIQPRYNSEALEFRIGDMYPLTEVRNKFIKNITLKISLADLSDQMVTRLTEIIHPNGGNCSIKLLVEDTEEDLKVTMPVKKGKTNLTNEFLLLLKKANIQFRLN